MPCVSKINKHFHDYNVRHKHTNSFSSKKPFSVIYFRLFLKLNQILLRLIPPIKSSSQKRLFKSQFRPFSGYAYPKFIFIDSISKNSRILQSFIPRTPFFRHVRLIKSLKYNQMFFPIKIQTKAGTQRLCRKAPTNPDIEII